MTIRPLVHDDLEATVELVMATMPGPSDPEARRAWLRTRTTWSLEKDPDGCWAAVDDDGRLVGFAVALVRDGIWGLSMLTVDPRNQARGVGRRLLEAALTTAERARGAIVCSSEDPRATRLYALAGFDLRPTTSANGIVDRSLLPPGLQARASEDFEATVPISRAVRGGAYDPADLAVVAQRPDSGLLLMEGRGFALHRDGPTPMMLCATDEEAATDLLLSCMAAGPRGATIAIDQITAGQDWAIRAALGVRLPLSADGPVFTRGELGPLRPWLPSGVLL